MEERVQSNIPKPDVVLPFLSQARQNVDALAKSIYSHMFDFVVRLLNEKLSTTIDNNLWVGVLDIFGFESFQEHPDKKGRVDTVGVTFV